MSEEELLITFLKVSFSGTGISKGHVLEEAAIFLPLMRLRTAIRCRQRVIKDLGEELLLDFNHPLVGFDLTVEGLVLK